MKLFFNLFAVLLTVASLAHVLPASAQQPIAGYVTRVSGEVQMVSEARRSALVLGQALLLGSKLITGPDARMQARMTDGTVLTLGGSTEFVLAQVAGATPTSQGSNFELFKGVFRAVTAPPETGKSVTPLQIRTPVAIIGVRGTDLWGGFNLLESGATTLDVVMLEGKGVYVENASGLVELAKGGDGTTVRGGASPTPLIPWGERKLKAALDSVSW